MAKVILLCGKICAGKTTYAQKLIRQHNAVYLSIDALMLKLFPEPMGEQYDNVRECAQKYLYKRAVDIIRA